MKPIPKVSVLIPSYNYARYIAQTIRSIQSQTFADFELLILDDGSTDDSFQIVQALAQQDPRIRAWQRPNKGLIPTLNELCEAATGAYIAQIDADDLWLPQRLAMGLEDLEQDPTLSASFCSYVTLDGEDKFLSASYHQHLGVISGRALMAYEVVQNRLCACTAFMRRSALAAAGGFARPFTLTHDWDRWLRLSLQGDLKLRSEVGAAHRWHGGNQSADYATSRGQQLQIMQELGPQVIAHYGLPERVLADLNIQIACLSSGMDNPGQAIEKLVATAGQSALSEKQQILFLQCLALSGYLTQARHLLGAMSQNGQLLAPASQRVLETVRRHYL